MFESDRGVSSANVKNELYPNPHVYGTECEFVLSFFLLAHG